MEVRHNVLGFLNMNIKAEDYLEEDHDLSFVPPLNDEYGPISTAIKYAQSPQFDLLVGEG